MNTSTKKRRMRFAGLALAAMTLGTLLMTAPTASAQFRRGGYYGGRPYGGFGGYGYRGNVYNRGYGGYGYGGPSVYTRGYGGLGYGGYGGGLYNQGYYGGNFVTPYASPIAVPGINIGIGSGYYGGLGGFN